MIDATIDSSPPQDLLQHYLSALREPETMYGGGPPDCRSVASTEVCQDEDGALMQRNRLRKCGGSAEEVRNRLRKCGGSAEEVLGGAGDGALMQVASTEPDERVRYLRRGKPTRRRGRSGRPGRGGSSQPHATPTKQVGDQHGGGTVVSPVVTPPLPPVDLETLAWDPLRMASPSSGGSPNPTTPDPPHTGVVVELFGASSQCNLSASMAQVAAVEVEPPSRREAWAAQPRRQRPPPPNVHVGAGWHIPPSTSPSVPCLAPTAVQPQPQPHELGAVARDLQAELELAHSQLADASTTIQQLRQQQLHHTTYARGTCSGVATAVASTQTPFWWPSPREVSVRKGVEDSAERMRSSASLTAEVEDLARANMALLNQVTPPPPTPTPTPSTAATASSNSNKPSQAPLAEHLGAVAEEARRLRTQMLGLARGPTTPAMSAAAVRLQAAAR
jgi:hypothetical protein